MVFGLQKLSVNVNFLLPRFADLTYFQSLFSPCIYYIAAGIIVLKQTKKSKLTMGTHFGSLCLQKKNVVLSLESRAPCNLPSLVCPLTRSTTHHSPNIARPFLNSCTFQVCSSPLHMTNSYSPSKIQLKDSLLGEVCPPSPGTGHWFIVLAFTTLSTIHLNHLAFSVVIISLRVFSPVDSKLLESSGLNLFISVF